MSDRASSDTHVSAQIPSLRVASTSSRVEIAARDGADIDVRGEARVTRLGDTVTVDDVRGTLRIDVPAGADVSVGSVSGRVVIAGAIGRAAVVSETGRVEIEQAASVDVRTQTSSVQVGVVAGQCRVRSTSGRVEIDRCARADVASETGRVEIHHVDGEVDAHCVSGRIELSLDRPHDVRAETVTGRIEVLLPRGATVFRRDHHDDRTLPPPDADCTVTARSTSGRVVVANR